MKSLLVPIAVAIGAFSLFFFAQTKAPDWVGEPERISVADMAEPGTLEAPIPAGKAVNFGKFSLTVGPVFSDATEYLETRNFQPKKAEKGMSYVRIPVIFENTSKKSREVTKDFELVAVDSQGREFQTSCPPFLADWTRLNPINAGDLPTKGEFCTAFPTSELENLKLLLIERSSSAALYFDLRLGERELAW